MAAPNRYLGAAFWPVSIWTSLAHLDEHPADDYVERTSPIVATAIGFWLCIAALIALVVANGGTGILGEDGAITIARRLTDAFDALWFIAPALYIIGLWLYAARDARYNKS